MKVGDLIEYKCRTQHWTAIVKKIISKKEFKGVVAKGIHKGHIFYGSISKATILD